MFRAAPAQRLVGLFAVGLLMLAGCTSPGDSAHDAAAGHGEPARLGGSASAQASDTAHGHQSTASPTGTATAEAKNHTENGHGTSVVSSAQASTYAELSEKTLAILQRKGPERALAALEKAVAKKPAGQGICHAVAHALGHAALEKFGNNAAKALRYRNDICGGGYTHGVVEIALAESKNVRRDLLRICAPANDGPCWHGIGHGALFSAKYHVQKAERLCSAAPNIDLVARCAEGIYMQLFTLDDGGQPANLKGYKAPTSKTAARTCRSAGGDFVAACWFYSPTVVLQETGEKWSKAIDWCAELNSGLGRSQCTAGIGSRLVKYHPDDIPFAARQCAKVNGDLRGRCLAGMGSYWSVHWHGTKTRASVCARMKRPGLVAQCRAVNAI